MLPLTMPGYSIPRGFPWRRRCSNRCGSPRSDLCPWDTENLEEVINSWFNLCSWRSSAESTQSSSSLILDSLLSVHMQEERCFNGVYKSLVAADFFYLRGKHPLQGWPKHQCSGAKTDVAHLKKKKKRGPSWGIVRWSIYRGRSGVKCGFPVTAGQDWQSSWFSHIPFPQEWEGEKSNQFYFMNSLLCSGCFPIYWALGPATNV